MKGQLNRYAEGFLVALNFFVIFLFAFESKLLVPLWLKPFGRMHPLVLHFPIVLLLLAMVMEFFRFRKEYKDLEFYKKFNTILLLSGLITTGIAAIMGFFLSREEGYSAGIVDWHKWTGTIVLVFGSIVYACRDSSWYKATAAKAGALVIATCLIFAGHFGAALTHGDNFIWQPVMANTRAAVPLEEAKVFDDVIRPVLEAKCIGCHNPDKIKGRLLLTDSASIVKGGKSGKLFVTGKPELSLLLKRLHLPLDDKKHMPPSGKPQLSDSELQLLHLWIKSDVIFNKLVVSLPAGDSLRALATSMVLSNGDREEVFHFAAAEEETVKKLNTSYRVVSPLANGSPALIVNIYNKEEYNAGLLEELEAVKLQIVSLELNKLPVKNNDLKIISHFENLERLDLNFTDITGEALATLVPLAHLQHVSLSGTQIHYQDLNNYLSAAKNLNTVSVWETGLDVSEIQKLQEDHKGIQIIGGFRDDGSNPIKLNLPRVKNKPPVFTDSLDLQLFHPVRNVEIRFTLDGTDPDSLTSPVYQEGTVLKRTTAIKARAYKKGWLSSDVADLNVFRCAYIPDSVYLLSKLNRVHPANGAQTFFDRQLGSFNANSPAWANNWAGFIRNDMIVLLEFKTPKMVSSVALNTLIEMETSIFPPESVEVWGGPSQDKMELMVRMKPTTPNEYRKPFITLVSTDFKPRAVSYLKIVARPVMKIPAWHKNKDNPALMLVDEMFVN